MRESERPEQTSEASRRVKVACPKCGQAYRVTARLLGRRLVCRHCETRWRASEAESGALVEGPSASRVQPVAPKSEPPSDSTRNILPEELPPLAGTSSTVIDTSWVGRQLGRYRIVSILGQGGMGVVWRGHDDTLNRDVALKILHRNRKSGVGSLNTELFMQEARAVAKLQHPAVVSIFDVGEDQGQIFLALELMEGGTLKEYVDQNGPMVPRELFELMIGPAKALSLAHKRGIIHRDIKPGNLMFDDHGHLKLMDFGLAEVAQEIASQKMKGKAVGSLGWVAPETVRGEGTTAQSDIYAMGLVMYFAVTGRPWLHAKSRSKLIAMHQNPPELDLSPLRSLTSRGQWLIQKCLAPDLAERFQTADELAEALAMCAEEDPIATFERRKSNASIALVAALFGLLIGTGSMMYYFLALDEKRNELSTPVQRYAYDLQPGGPQTTNAPEAAEAHRFRTLEEAHVPWPKVLDLIDRKQMAYVAPKDGEYFHKPSSDCGREILASNVMIFRNQEEAAAAGKKPCPQCKPVRSVPDIVMGRREDAGE